MKQTLLVLASLLVFSQSASADVFTNFLQDIENLKFPGLVDVQQGMQALQGVLFESEDQMGPAAAFFLMDSDTILLNQNDQDPSTGILKRVAALGPVDSSIVIHELWHSYYWNYFQNSGTSALALYNQEYQSRYSDYPSDVWEQIQEEGYALYIQEISRDYIQVYTTLNNATPAQRAALKANPRFIALYEQSFGLATYGYYRGDDGQPNFVTTPITQADKDSIMSFFFQNKLTGKFATDFSGF